MWKEQKKQKEAGVGLFKTSSPDVSQDAPPRSVPSACLCLIADYDFFSEEMSRSGSLSRTFSDKQRDRMARLFLFIFCHLQQWKVAQKHNVLPKLDQNVAKH